MKTFFYTTVAMAAFAANSILCRIALSETNIDPVSFTSIRLISGALTLLVLIKVFYVSTNIITANQTKNNWIAAITLFVYALAFSFAYIDIPTGTGAFILFASVQMSMLISTVYSGGKLSFYQWSGLLCSMIGLVFLLLPGIESPPMYSALLMVVAGTSWAIFTLTGKSKGINPLSFMEGAFLRTLPFVVLTTIFMANSLTYDPVGAFIAIISGAVTSGIGYAIWYYVLPSLKNITASVVQLTVPVIATFFGIILLNETLTLQTVASSSMILIGLFIVVLLPAKQTVNER